jgi:hypothetical protein
METKAIIEKFMTAYETQNSEYVFSLNSDFDGELEDKNYDDENSCEMDFYSLYGKKSSVYFLYQEVDTPEMPKLIFNRFCYADCDYDSDIGHSTHKEIPRGLYKVIRIKPVSEDELYVMRRILFDEYLIDTKRLMSYFVREVKEIEEFYVETFQKLFVNDSIEKIKEIVKV